MTTLDQQKLMEVAKQPGVCDLLGKARWYFAKSLLAELAGDRELADQDWPRQWRLKMPQSAYSSPE